VRVELTEGVRGERGLFEVEEVEESCDVRVVGLN